VPWICAILAFFGGIWLFSTKGNAVVTKALLSWFSSWQEEVWWQLLYIGVHALIWLSVLLVCLVGAAVVVGIVASPIYELISVRIERDMLGKENYHVPFGRVLRVLAGEFLKALVVMGVPVVLLLIPGVNLLTGIVAAFLLGWDFYDYPLARRGWNFRERWQFVRSEFWTVLGFGLWLAIPLAQVFLMPMAVAGGTILNIEALKRRGLTTANTKIKEV